LIKGGSRALDGRPAEPLYNCAHPSLVTARAQAQWLRAEQVRLAEADRQQREREAAEKRRLAEEERLRAEREAAERRRVEEERRRRQEI
jgi:translation initiation factor IF-2